MAVSRPGPMSAPSPTDDGGVWQRQAAAYHRFFSQFTIPVTGPLLDAARVAAGSRVLDVATGPGYAASAARDRGARALAADLSAAMLAQAHGGYPRLPLVRADAGRLPITSGAFTAVVANFYAAHMPDLAAGVAELARVLAPGGWLAVSAWDGAPGSHPAALLAEAMADVTGTLAGSAVTSASMAVLPECLHAAGLANVVTTTIRWTHPVTDADSLWDGLLASPVRAAAAILGTGEVTRRQIRERFRTLAAARSDPAGILRLPVSAVITAGQRLAASRPEPATGTTVIPGLNAGPYRPG
jgi:SAM-dependent methyltransferase